MKKEGEVEFYFIIIKARAPLSLWSIYVQFFVVHIMTKLLLLLNLFFHDDDGWHHHLGVLFSNDMLCNNVMIVILNQISFQWMNIRHFKKEMSWKRIMLCHIVVCMFVPCLFTLVSLLQRIFWNIYDAKNMLILHNWKSFSF